MAAFDSVIAAYLKGNVVNLAPLVEFRFRDAPQYLWGGEWSFTSGGKKWSGTKNGVVTGIDGLDQAATLESSTMTFTLSGVDPDIMALARSEDRAAYVGRIAIVYLQFFDTDWQPMADPWALKAGIMGTMAISRTNTEKGSTVSVALPANNIFYGRGVAPAAYYTDRDQKLRHPGDRGLEFITDLQDYSYPVPWR